MDRVVEEKWTPIYCYGGWIERLRSGHLLVWGMDKMSEKWTLIGIEDG